jgi:hypothetical protein
MSKRSIRLLLFLAAFLVLVFVVWRQAAQNIDQETPSATASSNSPSAQVSTIIPTASLPQEEPITMIPLAGPASESKSEISGMAWYGDNLILLPQYPSRFGSSEGAIFSLAKEDLLAFLDGIQTGPLSPIEIPFIAPDLDQIEGFQGFEAIAFSGDQVFLTIEARPDKMMGYLIVGTITPNLSAVYLDPATLTEIPPQVQIDNMTDEALLVTPDGVFSFFEANGVKNNLSPIVHIFSLDGKSLSTAPMVNLEYRLTDVTPLDNTNSFWGINYFFPGDTKLIPDVDPLTVRYDEGSTHSASTAVERLVQFQYSQDGITITNTPPIQLQLLPDDEARNWEALAYLDQRGFLIATDKFPETILAFVRMP